MSILLSLNPKEAVPLLKGSVAAQKVAPSKLNQYSISAPSLGDKVKGVLKKVVQAFSKNKASITDVERDRYSQVRTSEKALTPLQNLQKLGF